MSNIKFRLAKPSDAKQIAYVHYHIRDKYDKGFFAQVNYTFMKQYYKVVLNDPCEVVVCADKSTRGDSKNEYVTSKGARVEYWGWLPGRSDSAQSVVMQDILFYTMKMLGAEKLFFEVDKVNKRIFKFHKINGAEEVKTFIMPDGRERVELVYDMNNYNFKIK